ncbi:MAG: hypothetical protein V4697_00655 [Patescibacteria group bacterium]
MASTTHSLSNFKSSRVIRHPNIENEKLFLVTHPTEGIGIFSDWEKKLIVPCSKEWSTIKAIVPKVCNGTNYWLLGGAEKTTLFSSSTRNFITSWTSDERLISLLSSNRLLIGRKVESNGMPGSSDYESVSVRLLSSGREVLCKMGDQQHFKKVITRKNEQEFIVVFETNSSCNYHQVNGFFVSTVTEDVEHILLSGH